MKKTLSLFLAFVMMLSVTAGLNLSVFAEGTIEGFDIYSNTSRFHNINPAVGRTPCFDFGIPENEHASVYTTYTDGRGFTDGVSWYDNTAGEFITASDSFIVDHSYTLRLALKADEGYVFKTTEGLLSAVIRFQTDGETIGNEYFFGKEEASLTAADGSFDTEIVASATFTCAEPTVLDTAEIQFFTPEIGDNPHSNAYSIYPGYEVYTGENGNFIGNTIRWFHRVTPAQMDVMYADDEFERGGKYQAEVRIVADEGYVFKTENEKPAITATMGGIEASVYNTVGDFGYDASRAVVLSVDFECNEIINNIELEVDLSNYIHGGTPVFYAESADPDLYVYNNYENNVYTEMGVSYYVHTAEGLNGYNYPMEKTSTFYKGYHYDLTVAVSPADGYEFAFFGELNATINGTKASINTHCPFNSQYDSENYKKLLFLTITLDPCQIDINDCDIVDNQSMYKYDGKAKNANIDVYFGTTKLVKNVDYEILYMGNHTNAGTVHYEITGLGAYTGSKADYFVISKKGVVPKVLISANKYTYDGKVHKPTVKVYDGSKQLKASDYTVTYSAANPRAVNNYTVKVTLKGNYTGNKTVSFSILPKGTTLLKTASTGKDWISPQWKKQTKQTTGYEIMYSRSAGFKSGNKTVTVSKNTQTVKKITGLKKNTKYFFKIRTYKTVKVNGRNKTIYSSWSGVKEFKTKKK